MVGTTFFFGKLMTWMVYKINPENCEKPITKKDITTANCVMLISILLWGFIFFNLI